MLGTETLKTTKKPKCRGRCDEGAEQSHRSAWTPGPFPQSYPPPVFLIHSDFFFFFFRHLFFTHCFFLFPFFHPAALPTDGSIGLWAQS